MSVQVASANVFAESLKQSSGVPTITMKAAAFGISLISILGEDIADTVSESWNNYQDQPSVNDAVFGPDTSIPIIDPYFSPMEASPEYKKPKSGLSPKEAAKDIPSWAKGQRPYVGENGKDFAKRLLNDKYGKGNWKEGTGSEYNKLRKYGDRAFE